MKYPDRFQLVGVTMPTVAGPKARCKTSTDFEAASPGTPAIPDIHDDRYSGTADRGMSCYSVAEEIMPGSADFLVEQRGFELRTPLRCIREFLAV
jgi:hypothetical protein